jgi:hypothetical protein
MLDSPLIAGGVPRRVVEGVGLRRETAHGLHVLRTKGEKKVLDRETTCYRKKKGKWLAWAPRAPVMHVARVLQLVFSI